MTISDIQKSFHLIIQMIRQEKIFLIHFLVLDQILSFNN